VVLDLFGLEEESVRRSYSAGVEIWEVSVDGPDTSEILVRAEKAGIPAARAKGLVQLLEDEQLSFRGFLVHLPHPEVGTAAFFGLPWKVAGAERSGYRRPPLLGEDDQWMEAELAKSLPTPSGREGEV
jgi:crotonobetainyl-CoA:carnitine CoA-transferase CaiB-like acyl-CoA transferase